MRKKPRPSFRLFLFAESHLPDWDYRYPSLFPTLNTVFFNSGIDLVSETKVIDQGFCFNAGEWNFPDAPLRGLYARNRVYQGATGMESFAPWLERIEKQLTERALDEIIRSISPEWYADDYDAPLALLEQRHRRHRVPDLILEAKRCNRQPFPNWI